MSIEAGLIVAVMELKAVRAVTQAINANLPKDGPLGTIRPSSAQLYARPRHYYSPTPESRPAPRPVLEPMSNQTPRGDYYDRSTVSGPASCGRGSEPAAPWTMGETSHSRPAGPFDPPWKHLPPVEVMDAIIRVNLVRPKVDLINKGSLLDLYI